MEAKEEAERGAEPAAEPDPPVFSLSAKTEARASGLDGDATGTSDCLRDAALGLESESAD